MTVREFLEQTLDLQKWKDGEWYRRPRPRVVCKDGFSISIQANAAVYCHPRVNDLVDYVEVELGYPSELDSIIAYYAEKPGTTETVFPYVPISLVDELLNQHGGIDRWEYT